jgi:hypothetical protein
VGRALLAIPILAVPAVLVLATAGPSAAMPVRPGQVSGSAHGMTRAAATAPSAARAGHPQAGSPNCPARTEFCYIDIHFDSIVYCPSYTSTVGLCLGSSTGTVGFTAPLSSFPRLTATFDWGPGGGDRKLISYAVLAFAAPVVYLQGEVPGPNSADFDVRLGYSLESPDPLVRYYSQRRPGVKAGEVGGPLYLNFVGGRVGADVYIHGYLATENTRFLAHGKTTPMRAAASR